MKIVILIFLYISAFASTDFTKSYENLETAIEQISHKVTLKEKISLYYLSLATHDAIFTLLYKHKDSSPKLQETKKKMLQTIAHLQENNNITLQEVTHLRNLYASMNHEAKKLLSATKETQIPLTRVVSNNGEKRPYIKYILMGFTLLFMFISAMLTYLLYKTRTNNVKKDNFPMIDALVKHRIDNDEAT